MKNKNLTKYTVFVDDLFHTPICEDDSEYRYKLGEFNTYKKAVSACKKLIDDFIDAYNKDDLYNARYFWGEDPWIKPEPKGKHFSSSDYFEKCAKNKFGK